MNELVVGIENVKELKEQHIWWVALMSKTHDFKEMEKLKTK